jgi:hypothetical protein
LPFYHIKFWNIVAFISKISFYNATYLPVAEEDYAFVEKDEEEDGGEAEQHPGPDPRHL